MPLCLVLGLLLFHPSCFPQNLGADSLEEYFSIDSTDGISIISSYFPPRFIQNSMEIKSFIRTPAFADIRDKAGDLKSVDAIFIRAMKLTCNNTAMALLISTIACFDHRLVGLKVPIFALFFPLTNENESEFEMRIRNLPRSLYSDTPPGRFGDRDKLQHFFGSAFIAFAFESSEPAEQLSNLIEKGEDAIIIDGSLDGRDMRANRNGQEFGLALLENKFVLPSIFFIYNKE